LTAAEKLLIEELLVHVLAKVVTGGLDEAANLKGYKEAIEKLVKVLEHVNTAHGGLSLRREIFEWYQARDELQKATEEFDRALNQWLEASDEAKNVPRLDHVLAKAFTITFTFRAGERVSIVRRSRDGVTRALTPVESASIDGSWDSD
jgi:hypothetical protein